MGCSRVEGGRGVRVGHLLRGRRPQRGRLGRLRREEPRGNLHLGLRVPVGQSEIVNTLNRQWDRRQGFIFIREKNSFMVPYLEDSGGNCSELVIRVGSIPKYSEL